MSSASQSCPDYGFVNDETPSADRGSSFMMQVAFRPDPEVWVGKPKGDLTDPSDPRYGAMSDVFATSQYRLVLLTGPGPDAVVVTR
ncbi:MAG: hypothetical protein HYY06_05875 [Deltaproteobacteria bacterium]|nr:hypothetical protein [Deltaproteobacteria bacterium]